MSTSAQERLRRVAEQAEAAKALETRTVEEAKAGAGGADDAEDQTVAISEIKMLNLPEAYGIGSLRIFLRGIPSSRVPELVEAIFTAWPTPLYVASKLPLTPEGTFDVRAIAADWTQLQQDYARSLLPVTDDPDEKARQDKAVAAVVVTPQDFVDQLTLLEESEPGKPSLLDDALPGIARAVWLLAGGCPQNADWTVESLEKHMRDTFRLPDYARLANLLLEVNSVGGGYTHDLIERFTTP